jgi:membrane peptidoglycan carboxypeptidase
MASAVVKLAGATVVAGLLVAVGLFPFVGGLGLAAKGTVDSFESQQCDTTLLDQKPPQRTSIQTADGTVIANLYLQNRENVKLEQIPEWTRKAVVAIEDRRFYDHHGIDPTGTLRALVKSGTAGEVTQGGSTLTQQYVKQARLYLAKDEAEQKKATEQTAGRKLYEARCALALESDLAKKLGTKRAKEEIIGRYLNIANFGAGAYGIGVAARTYFNTTPDKLTLAQSALLAGVVNSPTRYNPVAHPKASKERRHEVLLAMYNQGYITKKQYQDADRAQLVPPGLKDRQAVNSAGNGCANATKRINNVGFFCDYVIDYLVNTLKVPRDTLYRGGLTIKTTIDPQMQQFAQDSIRNNIGYEKKATAVMNIIEPNTGYVRAMAVGRNYGNNPKQHETSIPLATKPVAGSGSTYKLFTTIAALRAKVPVKDFELDTYNTTKFDETTGRERQAYQPENCPQHPPAIANAGNYPEKMNLHDALYQSSNTFFEALIDQKFGCDLTQVVKAAQDLGMDKTLALENQHGMPQGKAAIDEHQISFTLGPLSTSPLELASAYGTLDNEGILCPARPILSIQGPDGKPLPGVRIPQCRPALEPGIARTITQILTDDTNPNAPNATAEAANLGQWPTAGKTGTSQNNAAVWFAGYTKQLVGVVGVFQPDSPTTPITDLQIPSNAIFGGTYPARIWHDAMLPIMQSRYQPEQFPPADDQVMNGDTVELPSVVGRNVEEAMGILSAAGFQPLVGEPKDGPAGIVVAQSPTGRAAPGSQVYIYPGNGKVQQPPGGGGGGGGHRRGGGGGGICLPGMPGC